MKSHELPSKFISPITGNELHRMNDEIYTVVEESSTSTECVDPSVVMYCSTTEPAESIFISVDDDE